MCCNYKNPLEYILSIFVYKCALLLYFFNNLIKVCSLILHPGEREGLHTSLDQNKALLVASKQREAELQGKVGALESQVHALAMAKDEVSILSWVFR